MLRVTTFVALVLGSLSSVQASEIAGVYLETRTCQVYTGPCFANSEIGLAGRDAIMAWSIESGARNGVDLTGLNVVVVVNATDTLAFRGLNDPRSLKSVVYVDDRANESQREALVEFAKEHAGRAGKAVRNVSSAPIQMSLDLADLTGVLEAGKAVKLVTRKARQGDCICSNESAYYPPLARVENFVPGVTIEGKFNGRGLGSRWTTPDARSAYMGTFVY